MGVVGESLGLVGECVGRIMHERLLTAFIAECLEEGACHVVQFDNGHIFTACNSAHCVGIVAVGFLYLTMSCLVEGASLSGSDEDDVAALCPHAVDEHLEVLREVIPRTASWLVLLLVVMPKLAEHVVAFLHLLNNLVETPLCDKRTCGKAAFCVIGNHHVWTKPYRSHLSPTGVWFAWLVSYC